MPGLIRRDQPAPTAPIEGAKSPTPTGAAPRLETERLWLRPWSAADVEGYARIVGDPDVMRYLGSGLRYRAKRAAAAAVAHVSDIEARRGIDRLIGHWRALGFGEWAVEEKASGELVGQIGLKHHSDWDADPTQVEVGWMLARRAWGRGFATEAATESLAFAFERLELDRVISIATLDNLRSVRVMERLGFSFGGQTRWKRSDVVWYAIDAADWKLPGDAGAR